MQDQMMEEPSNDVPESAQQARKRCRVSNKPKTIPFIGMVWKSWRKEFDTTDTMPLRENYVWWKEFESKLRDGDISENNVGYLAEIEEDSDSDEDMWRQHAVGDEKE